MAPTLRELLSLVRFEPRWDAVEGLEPFRLLLLRDSAETLGFLIRNFAGLDGEERGGIAFVIAEHAFRTGDLERVRRLFRSTDPIVRRSVLNALWEDPGTTVRKRAEPLRLAIRGAIDPDEGVRTEACRVFQNQSAWNVDVSSALGPLVMLLSDAHSGVRRQAAYAVGNLARARYDVAPHVAQLRRNARSRDAFVREAADWALAVASKSTRRPATMRGFVGSLSGGPGDLATNKKHMKGFGSQRSPTAEAASLKTRSSPSGSSPMHRSRRARSTQRF